jgi:hypothetical protein
MLSEKYKKSPLSGSKASSLEEFQILKDLNQENFPVWYI